MRFQHRTAIVLLGAVLAVSACGPAPRGTREPSTQPAEVTQAATPTPDMPTDLTPIVINGTPVIIPSAIEFTPTVPPTRSGPGDYVLPSATPDSGPRIDLFEVTPGDRASIGQPVTVRWEVSGGRAELSYEYVVSSTGTGSDKIPGGTIPLDGAQGSVEVTLREIDAQPFYVEVKLKVTSAEAGAAGTFDVIPLPVDCPYPWFFDNPPRWCASAVGGPYEGVMQRFEKAMLLAVSDPDAALTDHTVHILFDDHFWTTYTTKAAQTSAPQNEIDPQFYDMLQTAQFFNQPLGASVGGPSAASSHYQARYQCEFSPFAAQSISDCYFNLPDGTVIHEYLNGHYGRNGITWSEWKGEEPR